MLALIQAFAGGLREFITIPGSLLYLALSAWMFIDALRRREYLWVVLILAGMSIWYFFYVYRAQSSATSGFELPGSQSRKRIKELLAQIHHLDNAHHYFQLGDLYFQQGKLANAEGAYRASLERDPTDIDARAHLGQCLVRQKKAAEAKAILQQVCAENPKHDYGYSKMALAEALTMLGEKTAAVEIWRQVTSAHSYPRAKVQLAELLVEAGQFSEARAETNDVLHDDVHAPPYQRKRDRVWVRRARRMISSMPEA